MKVTLEQVENLRKRVECDYQTAERALRKTGGDEDQAVLYILKRKDNKWRKVLDVAREIMEKVLSFQLVLLKNGKVVFRVPILLMGAVVVLFSIPMIFVLLLALVSVFMGYEYEVGYKDEDPQDEAAQPMEKPETPPEEKASAAEAVKPDETNLAPQTPEKDTQQDYEEIIID